MKHQNKNLKDFKRLHTLFKEGAVFTSIDTETTSIYPTTGRIIEIGAVKFNKDGIISSWQKLFNPQTIIPPEIEELTHIKNTDVKNCDTIESSLPDFSSFIAGTILVAHNSQFDINFLNSEFQKVSIPVITNKTIDTLQFSIWALPYLEKHKLDFLADYFKINKGSSHRAFDDAITCMELFKNLLEISQRPKNKLSKN